MVHAPQLSLLEKTVTFISWALAGTIFLTVGWFALEPDDPLGAVTLLTREGALGVLVQVIAYAQEVQVFLMNRLRVKVAEQLRMEPLCHVCKGYHKSW